MDTRQKERFVRVRLIKVNPIVKHVHFSPGPPIIITVKRLDPNLWYSGQELMEIRRSVKH